MNFYISGNDGFEACPKTDSLCAYSLLREIVSLFSIRIKHRAELCVVHLLLFKKFFIYQAIEYYLPEVRKFHNSFVSQLEAFLFYFAF